MSPKSQKDFKEKLIGLALTPIGFISEYIFGKKLAYILFDIQKPDEFFCQEIAKKVKITSESLELPLQPPIEIRKAHPAVEIFVEGYDELYSKYLTNLTEKNEDTNFFYEPTLPNGIVINPKVQLIDEYEKTHDLKFSWHAYCLDFTEELPRNRKYTKLRISSDIPFESYLIRWFDWKPSEKK